MGAGIHDGCGQIRGRGLKLLGALGLVLAVSGCDLEPCDALDLRGLADTTALPGSVMAIGNTPGWVTVLRPCASPAECKDRKLLVKLPVNATPEQLMLTGSGRWLVYLRDGDKGRIDLDSCEGATTCTPEAQSVGTRDPDELIGTLRGGDWVVYRTWTETEDTRVRDSSLWAVYVGDEEIADDAKEFRIGPGLDLRVVAMGHRHLVARRTLGDGTDELYLVRIAPAFHVDYFGSSTRGDALLLAKGPEFQRVIISEGPSPAERGDGYEVHHDVPTDVQIIATSGQGPDARTLIYSVADLSQQANFPGEVVTKHAPLENVPGLSPISPNGSHLAYITPNGSLALRDLDKQCSCMVRSSVGATHLLAGFAADASLYFEAEEERIGDSPEQATHIETVQVYDPSTLDFTELTEPIGVWRLRAAPPQRDPVTGEHWAVVSGNDNTDAVVRPGELPRSLDLQEASYLPRGDRLWVIEARDADDEVGQGANKIALHEVDAETKTRLYAESYAYQATVCVATSQSAARTTPWATRCSPSTEPKMFLDNGWPDAEQGP